ncbi:MAG TPA: helix-turn-helix transcriptional regulator [Cellulomonas sp.]
MPPIPVLSGEIGSAEQEHQYASYYASIADQDRDRIGPHVTTYALRPGTGEGTIEVTRLHGGLRVIRYDVRFAADHPIGYRFSADRFELESCLDGQMRIVEDAAGRGDLGRGSTSLTPSRPTEGMVVHPAGQLYRGVSLTGRRDTLAPYLGSVGTEAFAAALDRLGADRADDLYLGRGTRLLGVPRLLAELFGLRADTPGRTLLMESRVMAAFALLTDASPAEADHGPTEHPLAEHEVEALRNVPLILWRERHAPPTLDEVARLLSMSPKRLARGFKALYGVPPMERHRRQCLERAADLLLDTRWTVERIGAEVGYGSASSFVYAFRRRLGCTPAEYRRTHA